MTLSAKRVVVLGATSAIGAGIAERYAAAGSSVFLVGRNEHRTKQVAETLTMLGASKVAIYLADLRARDQFGDIVRTAVNELGGVDLVIIAHAVLPVQAELDYDVDASMDTLITNMMSPIELMHRFALVMEGSGGGSMVVLSSVAGDRGRKGMTAYATAKAAVSAYAAGLRGRFADRDVHILTVKPGPVRTPMTEGRALPLMAGLEPVVTSIVRAIERKAVVIYTPWFWRPIAAALRLLPERVVMKLSL